MIYNEYTLSNALILFGAIQGFTLCFFLYKRKKDNPLAYFFFILFLFSLAFTNLWYSLFFMDMYDNSIIYLTNFPFPEEYLIGVGFYFYIKTQIIKQEKKPFYKKESYLFIPAILYGLFELYCYIIALKEGNRNIINEIDASGFYIINEFIRLIFNLGLGVSAFLFLKSALLNHKLSPKLSKNIDWLFSFSKVFIGFAVLSLASTGAIFLFEAPNINFFYLTFFINVIFIYWIGYLGYTKSNLFFFKYQLDIETNHNEKQQSIEKKLIYYIHEEEKFIDQDISLTKLSTLLGISGKELSEHINTIHKMNFSEYVNSHRVRKVKLLLDSPEYKQYTLEAISSEAGFSSKSSFNTIFKKSTGYTPSQYKKRHQS